MKNAVVFKRTVGAKLICKMRYLKHGRAFTQNEPNAKCTLIRDTKLGAAVTEIFLRILPRTNEIVQKLLPLAYHTVVQYAVELIVFLKLICKAGKQCDVELRRLLIKKIAPDKTVGRAVVFIRAHKKGIAAYGLFGGIQHRLIALALVLVVSEAGDLIHVIAVVVSATEQLAKVCVVFDGAAC